MAFKYRYVCEACGETAVLTEKEAFRQGWDYPPFMGKYGVVSARTCPNCTVNETAWWALMVEHKPYAELTEKQKETVKRILEEPRNMIPVTE